MLTPEQITQIKAVKTNGTPSPTTVHTTPEQAKASFGGTSTLEPGMLSRMGTDIKNTISNAKEQITGTGANAGEIAPQRGVELAANITGLPVKLANELPGVKQATELVSKGYSAVVNWLGDKIGDTKAAQDFVMQHPEAAKALENITKTTGALSETAMNVGVIKGGISTVKEIKPALENLKQAKEFNTQMAATSPEEIAIKRANESKLNTSTINDATPSYNKKIVGEPGIKQPDGTILPRVNESKGTFAERTVNPTQSEIAAGNELKTVPGYDKLVAEKATSLQKAQLVDNEISTRGQALEISLKNEKVLRPPKEISKLVKDSVNKASEDSLLLQKTDPAVKNYIRVANRAIKQADGTLAGELEVRKALDRAYEDAGGKYMNNKGLDQIHRAARNALNDDMELKAQNTQVKASLKSQSNLYNANDVLWDKAKAEGGSAFERYVKVHPVIYNTVKAGLKATGFGAGLHIIP